MSDTALCSYGFNFIPRAVHSSTFSSFHFLFLTRRSAVPQGAVACVHTVWGRGPRARLREQMVQMRNFLFRPQGAGNRAYRPTAITTDPRPTSAHTSTATATNHEPWDTRTYRTYARAPSRLARGTRKRSTHACPHRRSRTPRAQSTLVAPLSSRQPCPTSRFEPFLPCTCVSRAQPSHARGGCVRHERACVSRVGYAAQVPPACI